MAKQYSQVPEVTLTTGARYEAVVHTSEGDFTIELLPEKAPITVNSFVTLARDGYFDGIVFHRIVKDFVIQTGDPTGTGMGGPGYRFQDELPPALEYGPGVVAMANAGPNTNGSQFFVCTGDRSSFLNQHPNYTVFGKVTAGMDVVEKINNAPVGMSPSGEMSRPLDEVTMLSVEVQETTV